MPPARCGAWRLRQSTVANQAFRRLEGRRWRPAESDAPVVRTAHLRRLPPRPLAVRDRQGPPRSRLMDAAPQPRLRAKVRSPPLMSRSPNWFSSRSRKRVERNRRAGKRSGDEVQPRHSMDCDARRPHPLHQPHAPCPHPPTPLRSTFPTFQPGNPWAAHRWRRGFDAGEARRMSGAFEAAFIQRAVSSGGSQAGRHGRAAALVPRIGAEHACCPVN